MVQKGRKAFGAQLWGKDKGCVLGHEDAVGREAVAPLHKEK